MATTQSTSTRLPAFNERLNLQLQVQIVRAKIEEYVNALSGPERHQLPTIHNLEYQQVVRDADHTMLARLLNGETTHHDHLKHLNGMLDYRLRTIKDAAEYVSFLPWKAEKFSGDNCHNFVHQTLFEIGADIERQKLYYIAHMHITNEKLFMPPAPGQGLTFDKPIRHLASVLGKQYPTEEQIKACVKELKDRKKSPPPRQVSKPKATTLPGMCFDEEYLNNAIEHMKTKQWPPFPQLMPEVKASPS
jgi:hypothetical protein